MVKEGGFRLGTRGREGHFVRMSRLFALDYFRIADCSGTTTSTVSEPELRSIGPEQRTPARCALAAVTYRVVECWNKMNSGQLIVVLWLLLPVALVSPVWWFWFRGHRDGKKWRRTATLISAAATTVSSALMVAMLISGGRIRANNRGVVFHP